MSVNAPEIPKTPTLGLELEKFFKEKSFEYNIYINQLYIDYFGGSIRLIQIVSDGERTVLETIYKK